MLTFNDDVRLDPPGFGVKLFVFVLVVLVVADVMLALGVFDNVVFVVWPSEREMPPRAGVHKI